MKFSLVFVASFVAALPTLVPNEFLTGAEHALQQTASHAPAPHLGQIHAAPPTTGEIGHAVNTLARSSSKELPHTEAQLPRFGAKRYDSEGAQKIARLADPAYEPEKIKYECGPSCLPMTGHGLNAPIRHGYVFFNYKIKGLSPRKTYYVVKDMKKTIEMANSQIERLERVQNTFKDMAPTDLLYVVRDEQIRLAQQDITAWEQALETSKRYLSAAENKSRDKKVFDEAFLAKVSQNYKDKKKPLIRPDTLNFDLENDIILGLRSAMGA